MKVWMCIWFIHLSAFYHCWSCTQGRWGSWKPLQLSGSDSFVQGRRETAIHTYRQLSVDSLLNACEMWEEFGVAAVNPCKHRERQTESWHLPKSLLVNAKWEFTIWDTAKSVCKIALHDCWKISVKVVFMASKVTWFKNLGGFLWNLRAVSHFESLVWPISFEAWIESTQLMPFISNRGHSRCFGIVGNLNVVHLCMVVVLNLILMFNS